MAASKPLPPSKPLGKLPVLPLLLIALLLGLALFGHKGVLRLMQAGRQRTALEQKLERLKATDAALRQEIVALRTNRRYIEEIARQELGMVKKDELIYQFPTEARRKGAKVASRAPLASGP